MLKKRKKFKSLLFLYLLIILFGLLVYLVWFIKPYWDFLNKHALWSAWLYPKSLLLSQSERKSDYLPTINCGKTKFIKDYFPQLPVCQENKKIYYQELKANLKQPEFLLSRKRFVAFWEKTKAEKTFSLPLKKMLLIVY